MSEGSITVTEIEKPSTVEVKDVIHVKELEKTTKQVFAPGFTKGSAERILKAVKKTQGSNLPPAVLQNLDMGVMAALKGEMRQSEISFKGENKTVRIITCPADHGDVVESKEGQKFRIIVVPDNSKEPIKAPSGLVSPEGKAL